MDPEEPDGFIESSGEPEPAELHAPAAESRAIAPVPQDARGTEFQRKVTYLPDTHRLLPQSPDAERGVLSSFLLAPIAVGGICREQGVTSAHFFIPAHAEIYDTLLALWEEGENIDFITLTQVIRDKGRLDQCGGAAFVTELFTFLPTAANVAYYIEILLEKYVLRLGIIYFTAITARCYEQQDDVPQILLDIQVRATEICDSPLGIDSGVEVMGLHDLLTYPVTDNPDTIIGRHWLMKGGSSLWVGPSGIGKSSLAMQVAVHFALGIPIFGIKPVRPLKSVFVQAENDKGDLAEMAQGVFMHLATMMGKEPDQAMMDLLKKNLVFIRDTQSAGLEFAGTVRRLCRKHAPDLFWADPLLSYVGDDISKQAVASQFLRNWLNPILAEFGVCMMFMHHTGKPPTDPKSRANWQESDMSYIAFGSSELTNWARAINVLRPVGDGVFELHLVKRGKRAGALDLYNLYTDKIYLKHSEHGIAWEQIHKPAEPEEEEKPKKKAKGPDDEDGKFKAKHADVEGMILAKLTEPPAGGARQWERFEVVKAVAKQKPCSEGTVRNWIASMIEEKQIVLLPGAHLGLPELPLVS